MQLVVKLGIAAILALQAGYGLYLGLPGHLSSDSIIQFYEGRTLHFISYNPPLMSLLLGVLDRLGSAPVGFVVLSQTLLSAATCLVFAQSGRITLLRLGLAAVVLLNPVVLIYVGIVWKDVLLAHAVAVTYFLIAWMRHRRQAMTPWLAVLVLALLTVIVGARQQGLLFAIPAALWAATTVRASRRVRVLAGIAFLVLPIAAEKSMNVYAREARASAPPDAVSTGWRMLAQFDLAGVLVNGGALPADTPPALAEELREQSLRYSPYRVDTLTGVTREFWALSGASAVRLWLATIVANPGAYARHRMTHFAALLGIGDTQLCLPIFTGVAGPVVHSSVDRDLTALLGLTAGPSHVSTWVFEFGRDNGNTPLFMHLAYAAALVPIGLWLFRRREYVLATLVVCMLLFLASYSVVGIACDFRYAYALTVATTLLVAYACLNVGSAGASPGRRTVGP